MHHEVSQTSWRLGEQQIIKHMRVLLAEIYLSMGTSALQFPLEGVQSLQWEQSFRQSSASGNEKDDTTYVTLHDSMP